jgi:hypothetical protein
LTDMGVRFLPGICTVQINIGSPEKLPIFAFNANMHINVQHYCIHIGAHEYYLK